MHIPNQLGAWWCCPKFCGFIALGCFRGKRLLKIREKSISCAHLYRWKHPNSDIPMIQVTIFIGSPPCQKTGLSGLARLFVAPKSRDTPATPSPFRCRSPVWRLSRCLEGGDFSMEVRLEDYFPLKWLISWGLCKFGHGNYGDNPPYPPGNLSGTSTHPPSLTDRNGGIIP